MIRSRVTAILIYKQALKPIVCCTPKFSREIFIIPLSHTLTLPIDAKKILLTSPSNIEVSLILQIDYISKALTLTWLTYPYSLAMGWLKSFLKRRTKYITYLVTLALMDYTLTGGAVQNFKVSRKLASSVIVRLRVPTSFTSSIRSE